MRVFLAHGASGSAESMRPHVEGLLARGVDGVAVGLPRGRAERAVAAYRAQVADPGRSVVGGHSFGGRVASLLAAAEPVRGLVLLSYPLHRPGAPESRDERTSHWPAIGCPVLLLSGTSDPFARIDLLQEAVRWLPNAELVTYARLGHGLAPVLDDVLDRVAAFTRALDG